MNCDCAIYTGKTHAICEDYAKANDSFVALSDGCSSSPNTDFGSRLLVQSVEKMLLMAGTISLDFYRSIAGHARAISDALGLCPECLDATLGIIVVKRSNNGKLYAIASLLGDGAVICKYASGCTNIFVTEFSSGFPAYPNYLLDQNRLKGWDKANIGKKRIVRRYTIIPDKPIKSEVTEWDPIPDQALPTFEVAELDLEDRKDRLECIAIMSDGLGTFFKLDDTDTSRISVPISEIDVAQEIMAFKSYNSDFVQRRMQRFMRDNSKRGWEHADDFSIAAIYTGDINEDNG
jgi:hypothetical protein